MDSVAVVELELNVGGVLIGFCDMRTGSIQCVAKEDYWMVITAQLVESWCPNKLYPTELAQALT